MRRKIRETGELITSIALGSRGDEKTVKKTIEKAKEEGR